VPLGTLDPNDVHTPEFMSIASWKSGGTDGRETMDQEEMARRVAESLRDGATLTSASACPPWFPTSSAWPRDGLPVRERHYGIGPRPPAGEEVPELIDAGSIYITLRPGPPSCPTTSPSRSSEWPSRRTVLGAFQVSERGDLASWLTPARPWRDGRGDGSGLRRAQRLRDDAPPG